MPTLDQAIVKGTFASRPSPSALTRGRLYFATDTHASYYDDGAAWVDVSPTGLSNPMTTAGDLIVGGSSGAPTRLAKGADGTVLTMVSGSEAWAAPSGGGGGALAQIAQTVLSSAASSVTFSSIPGTYSALRLMIKARGSSGSNGCAVYLQFNGDTGSNYSDNIDLLLQGAGRYPGAGYGLTASYVANVPIGSDNTNSAGVVIVDIPGYADTVFNKSGYANGFAVIGAVGSRLSSTEGGFEWASTAAINSIKVLIQSGAFVAGSAFTLHGLE